TTPAAKKPAASPLTRPASTKPSKPDTPKAATPAKPESISKKPSTPSKAAGDAKTNKPKDIKSASKEVTASPKTPSAKNSTAKMTSPKKTVGSSTPMPVKRGPKAAAVAAEPAPKESEKKEVSSAMEATPSVDAVATATAVAAAAAVAAVTVATAADSFTTEATNEPEVQSEPVSLLPEVQSEPVSLLPEVQSEPVSLLPEVQSEPVSLLPEVKSELAPQSKSELAPEPSSELQLDTKFEITTEAQTDILLESELLPEPKSELAAERQSEVLLETECEVAPEPESEVATEPEPKEPEVLWRTESEVAPEPKSILAPEPEPEPELAPEPQTEYLMETESEVAPEPKYEVEPQSEIMWGTEPKLAPEPQSEVLLETESEYKPEPLAETTPEPTFEPTVPASIEHMMHDSEDDQDVPEVTEEETVEDTVPQPTELDVVNFKEPTGATSPLGTTVMSPPSSPAPASPLPVEAQISAPLLDMHAPVDPWAESQSMFSDGLTEDGLEQDDVRAHGDLLTTAELAEEEPEPEVEEKPFSLGVEPNLLTWGTSNPFADTWAQPTSIHLTSGPLDIGEADPEMPNKSPAEAWLEKPLGQLAEPHHEMHKEMDNSVPVDGSNLGVPAVGMSQSSTLSGTALAAHSSSETSTPEELRDYDSSSGVESPHQSGNGAPGTAPAAASPDPATAGTPSPSSGLCTIYEAMETSEDEDEDRIPRQIFPAEMPLRAANGNLRRPPPRELDWNTKVDMVQQLINQALLLEGEDGCPPLLYLPGQGGGILSPLESSLWPHILPQLSPTSATITAVSSYSPTSQGSVPQGDWTVVELETHH
uniref:BTB/POZ domain-containing protein n=1 Tax=Astyanax mexicanus TaxID=7994 RepID=A0A3B1IJF8_ASTMX